MRDENGVELSDGRLLRDSLHLLAHACEHLFEIQHDDAIRALAFMVDRALDYGTAISLDEDPLLSEDTRYQRRMEAKTLDKKLNKLAKLKEKI